MKHKFYLFFLYFITVSILAQSQNVIYVNDDAAGNNDGTSWQNAYTDLSVAIDAAQNGDELWVAAGIYYPTSQPNYSVGSADQRFNHFTLKNGVTLYGGFAGDESSVDLRDLTAYKTVLSGDIDQNDNVGADGYVTSYTDVVGSNSFKLFYFPQGSSIDTTAVLDGFVLAGGVANKDVFPYMGGAAFQCSDASPKVANCEFYGNYAMQDGGAIWINQSSMIIENCTFSGNYSEVHGGAVFFENTSALLNECTFTSNTSKYGGAVYIAGGEETSVLKSSVFDNNNTLSGGNGGGISISNAKVFMKNTSFTNNTADSWGGGVVFHASCDVDMVNCIVNGNYAGNWGGGIGTAVATPDQRVKVRITNTRIQGNETGQNYGGGIALAKNSDCKIYNSLISGNKIQVKADNYGGAAVTVEQNSSIEAYNCTFVSNNDDMADFRVVDTGSSADIYNSIIWDNAGDFYEESGVEVNVYSSRTHKYHSVNGNTNANPLFINNPNDFTPPTTGGNFSLWGNSPVNNKGSNTYLPVDTYDLDNDGDVTEPIPYDLNGNERIFAGVVDLGCFEQQFESVSGNKLSFKANKSKVDMGSDLTLNSTDFTIEMWIKPQKQVNGSHFNICGNKYPDVSTSNRAPSLYIFQHDRIHYGYGDGTNWNAGDTEKALKIGQWNHIAMTFNDATNTLKLYSNGRLLEEFTGQGEVSSTPLDYMNAIDSLNADLDEFRVWKQERTQQELIDNMNHTLSGNEENLALYYSFDQVTSGTIEDQSGINNGTMINDPGIFNSDAILTPVIKGVENVGIDNFTFSWFPVPNTMEYYIDVATAPDFKNLVLFGEPTGGATSYTVNGLSRGTVYYYKVTSRTHNDNWGRQTGHTATKLNPPGNAIAFDGSTYIDATDVTKYDFSGTTIETWVKVDADQLNTKWALWACNPADFKNNYVLFYGAAGNIFSMGQYDYNASSWVDDSFAGSTLTADTWHHVAVVIDKDNNLGKLYLDGADVGSFIPVAHPYPYGSYFSIGQEFDESGEGNPVASDHIKGSMDEFRIWSKALSQSEIQDNMNNTLTGNEDGLVTYYNFDLQTGIKVIDNANIFDGEIVGNVNWVESTIGLNDFVVEATNSTTTGFNLNWSAVTGATDYTVDVATDASFNNVEIALASTSSNTTYDADGLTEGTKYYFRVVSDNGDTSMVNYTNTLMEVPGNALLLDGKDDYVDISQVTEMGNKNYATMECWAYLDPTETTARFIAINTATGGNKYLLSFDNSKGYYLYDQQSNQSISSYDTRKGAWVHLAVTMRAYNTCEFFMNGELVGTTSNGYAPLFSGNLISFGQEFDGSSKSDFLKGAIDEVRFWSDIRSQAEIQSNMHKKLTGDEEGLLAYYDFDQDEGQFVYEKVNGLDGKINSQPQWVQSDALITPLITSVENITANSATINWTTVDGASDYKIEVATDIDFNTVVQTIASTSNATTYELTGLQENTDYFIRVASQTNRWSAWSMKEKVSTLLIPPGNAYIFDGTNYISLDDVTNEDYSNGATIDLWVKPIQHGRNRSMIWANNTSTGDNHYVLNYNPESQTLYLWGTSVGVPVNLNYAWNHIAVVLNNSTASYIYVNGEEIATFTENKSPLLSNSRFSIGQEWDDDTPSDFYEGNIDEVRIWNKALSLAEIKSYYHTTIPGNEPGLVAYFNFDETSGSYVYDASNTYSGEVIGNTNRGGSKALITPFAEDATNITNSGFTANWDSIPGASNYILRVATDRLLTQPVEGLDSIDMGNVLTYDITGLQENTGYYFGVMSITDRASAWGISEKVKTTGSSSGELALATNGASGFLDLTSQMSRIEGLDAGAITGWFKGTQSGNILKIYGSGDNTMTITAGDIDSGLDGESMWFILVRDGSLIMSFGVREGHDKYLDGNWHHFAVITGDGNNRFVIDGKEQETEYYDGAGTMQTAEFSNISNQTDIFLGDVMPITVDELAFYKNPITTQEAVDRAHQKLTGDEMGLIAYYNFDNSNAADSSGMGRDAAIVGTVEYEKANVLTTPFLNEVVPGVTLANLSWEAIEGATEYILDVATDKLFQEKIVDNKTVTTNNYTANKLDKNTKYFYRVKAKVNGEWSECSSTGEFNTLPGKAIQLDGIDDYLTADKITQEASEEATIECWVKMDENAPDEAGGSADRNMIWAINTSDGGNHYVLVYYPYVKQMSLWAGGGTIEVENLDLGTSWHHIAVSLSNSGESVIYLDGKQIASANYTANAIETGCKFSIGQEWDGTTPSDFFMGQMDEFRIWDIALTQEQVRANMNLSEPEGAIEHYIAHFTFDEIFADTTIVDKARMNDAYMQNNPVIVNSEGVIVPITLEADNPTLGAFDMHINDIASAESFEIEVAYDETFVPPLAVHENIGRELDYTVEGLCPGVKYYFRARAIYNESTISNWSIPDTISTVNQDAEIQNFVATQGDYSQNLKLTWECLNEYLVTDFKIQRRIVGEPEFSYLATVPNSTDFYQYTDTLAEPGTYYEYTIQGLSYCYNNDTEVDTSNVGFNIPALELIKEINDDTQEAYIRLDWNYNSGFCNNVEIERINTETGITQVFQEVSDSLVYRDGAVELCTPYSYQLIAKTADFGDIKSHTKMFTLEEDIFEAIDTLDASKGYSDTKITLSWISQKQNIIDEYQISRRKYATGNDWQVVKIIERGSTQTWIDEDANPGEYYEYLIVGIGSCGDDFLFTDSVTSIGFRQPEGLIAGQVTYEGGNPVFDVKLTLNYEDAAQTLGRCLYFDGADELKINPVNTFDFTNGMTIEMWTRPTSLDQDFVLFNNQGIDLSYNNAGNLTLTSDAAIAQYDIKTDAANAWNADSWNHIAVSLLANKATILINGQNVATVENTTNIVFDTTSIATGFDGYIDELRVWDIARTDSVIDRYHNLVIGRDEEGLVTALRFDEGLGEYVFDHTRTDDEPNKSHARIYGAEWSANIPSLATLSLGAKTELNGNYQVKGIWFKGSGNTFSLTPSYGVHEFDPATRSLLVSENSLIFSNQDYTDISAFVVTGNVKYYGANFPVEDVMLAVDGQICVNAEGMPITTDNLGNFEIEVPIGEHFISVQKINHVFSEGYFPPKDENGEVAYHLFDNPVSGIQFIDSTFMTVAGRIVGGTIEADKPIGFDKSKNNLGVCEFTVEAVKGYPIDGTNSMITVATDASSGEYEVKLYPEKYQFVIDASHKIGNNLYTFNSVDDLTMIDLSNPMLENTDTDTATIEVINGDDVTYYDTVYEYNYHLQRNWVHRSVPSIEVLSVNENPYFYDSIVPVQNADGDTIQFTLINADGSNRLDYPVFRKGAFYSTIINVFEEYENADNADIDRVPVQDGNVEIINGCASYPAPVEFAIENGQVKYDFIGGFPNPTQDALNPELSYTKTFEVHSYTGEGGAMHSQWPGAEPFRAYVFGGIPTGTNFVTQGPDQVDFILRDPPGSNSYAYFEEGFTTSNTVSHSFENSSSINNSLEIDLGWEVTTFVGFGAGIISTNEQVANMEAGIGFESTYEGGHSRTESTTFTQSYSTSDDMAYVGEQGDLFFGHSTNITYGVSNCINIIPVGSGEEELNANVDGFTVGLNKGLNLGLQYGTQFIYTQNHIENYLIPDLEMFYEQFLAEGNEDSANYYRQQADLWRKTLAENEFQKYYAIKMKDYFDENKNISFDAGAIYEESLESEVTESNTSSFEFSVNTTVSTELGFEILGMGSTWKMDSEFSSSTTTDTENTSTESRTVGFVLNDGDQGDYFSLDVLKCPFGNGPVFSTLGGQSACPYEGGTKVEYADYVGKPWAPADFVNGFQLNYPTMRIEVPKISAVNAIVAGVPDNEPAVFTLKLSNQSEVNADSWFTLKLDAASNPYGAKLKMDGAAIVNGVSIMIPGGTTLTKTLELEKGQDAVNDYEGINLILHSQCQFDPTDDIPDIADTVTISANFVPTCTDVAILNPTDNWLVNADARDTLNVKIGDYNVNHGTFEKMAFQYKAESDAAFSTLAMFFNDTTEFAAYQGEKYKINGADFMNYKFDMTALQDRSYQIRAVSLCTDGSQTETAPLTGILDGNRPQVFGTPGPADGILSANDEIMITFNEPIEEGLVTNYNIEVSGVLNGAEINHGTSVQFDGEGDYALTPDGINLIASSYAVEFWMQKPEDGVGTVFSQGTTDDASFAIYYSSDSIHVQCNDKIVSEANSFDDGNWHHWAVVYDATDAMLAIYADDQLVVEKTFADMLAEGPVYFAKNGKTDAHFFEGKLHDMRIWNKALAYNDIIERMNIALTGDEIGLVSYWPMNEGEGSLLIEESHSRHATLFAEWISEPASSAYAFNGYDQALGFFTGAIPISQEMDVTMEMWFKGNAQPGKTCLFSNGNTEDGSNEEARTFAVYVTQDGAIEIANNGIALTANNNYMDDHWHHFAFTLNRRGYGSIFIDGEKIVSLPATNFGSMESAYAYVGALGYLDNQQEHQLSHFFNGSIDEVRIWNLARKQEQLGMYKNTRLAGTETGLQAYFPFEVFEEAMGVMLSTPSLDDQSVNAYDPETNNCGSLLVFGEESISSLSPNIKRELPKQNVNFDFVINNDQIIITPSDPLALIEKCILEITVKNIEDKHANKMASPVTWTAYIEQNEVIWGEDLFAFEKELNEALSFETTIRNIGGLQQTFAITNLPQWLNASPVSGTIPPNDEIAVQFSVVEGLNIGTYNEDIFLESSSGYNERLSLNLRVYKEAPNWTVNAEAFDNSMNIIAQLKIKDVFSNDPYDKLAVFVDDECRGVAEIVYKENYDDYFLFLVVYGNEAGEELSYKVWDASVGEIYTDVAPVYDFEPNGFYGAMAEPVVFEAGDRLNGEMDVNANWNWISFNLSLDDNNVNKVFESLDLTEGDILKHAQYFTTFDAVSQSWFGSLNTVSPGKLYRLNVAREGLLNIQGGQLKTADYPIELVTGWNRVGYIPTVNLTVNEALAGFEPELNDVIKSQYQFALWDGYEWIGSLGFMQAGKGYMYKSQSLDTITFVYPNASSLSKKGSIELRDNVESWSDFNPNAFEYSMSIVAKLMTGEVDASSEIGAYIDGQLRGKADLISENSYTDYCFITVYGNAIDLNKTIHFRLMRNNEVVALSGNSLFNGNNIDGTLDNPVELSAQEATGVFDVGGEIMQVSTYPNPFTDKITVDIHVESAKEVSIQVMNILGETVDVIASNQTIAGTTTFTWNVANAKGNAVESGIFFIQIKVSDQMNVIPVIKK